MVGADDELARADLGAPGALPEDQRDDRLLRGAGRSGGSGGAGRSTHSTYLSHPTVPWLPLPPMTEGNPLFVNKNIIEMLALIAIAAHPTGRWLGIDALICRLFCRKHAQG